MRGDGGTWNRAGRRSGGNRPVEILVPRNVPALHFRCPSCSNDSLPSLVTSGCATCRLICDALAAYERRDLTAFESLYANLAPLLPEGDA